MPFVDERLGAFAELELVIAWNLRRLEEVDVAHHFADFSERKMLDSHILVSLHGREQIIHEGHLLLLWQSLGIAQKRLLQIMPPPADLDEIDADLDEIDEVASRILREQFRVEGRNGRYRLRHKISCERYPEVFSECNRAKMPVDPSHTDGRIHISGM